jgi:surface antigen
MTSLVNDPDTTASILPEAPSSQLGLSDEDWIKASQALDKALDPQQAGASVRWSNAESGRSGVFVAAGQAFVRNDQVCRLFKASLAQHPQDQSLLGTACRAGGGMWSLQKVKPLPQGT